MNHFSLSFCLDKSELLDVVIQQSIDEEDEKLRSLKDKLGVEVYRAVTTALVELYEHNTSGSPV